MRILDDDDVARARHEAARANEGLAPTRATPPTPLSPLKRRADGDGDGARASPATPSIPATQRNKKSEKKKKNKKTQKRNEDDDHDDEETEFGDFATPQKQAVVADADADDDARRALMRETDALPYGDFPKQQLIDDWAFVFAQFGTAAPRDIMQNVAKYLQKDDKVANDEKERTRARYELTTGFLPQRKGKYSHVVFARPDMSGIRDTVLAHIAEALSFHSFAASQSHQQAICFLKHRWLPFALITGISPVKPSEGQCLTFLVFISTNGRISNIRRGVDMITDENDRRRYRDRVQDACDNAKASALDDRERMSVDDELAAFEAMRIELSGKTIRQYWCHLKKWLSMTCGDDENPADTPLVNVAVRYIEKNTKKTNPNAPKSQESIPPPPSFFHRLLLDGLATVTFVEAWEFKFTSQQGKNLSFRVIPPELTSVIDENSPINAKTMCQLRDLTMVLIATFFCLRGGEAFTLQKDDVRVEHDTAKSRFDVDTRPGGRGDGLPPLATMRITLGRDKMRTASQNARGQLILPASVMTTRLVAIYEAYMKLREQYRRLYNCRDEPRVFDVPGLNRERDYPTNIEKNGSARLNFALQNMTKLYDVSPHIEGTKFTGHTCRKAGATILNIAGKMDEVELRNWGRWSAMSTVMGSTYVRRDTIAVDGGRAHALCRFLMSGFQDEIVPLMESSLVREQVIYEREAFQSYEQKLLSMKLPDEVEGADQLHNYVNRGWYQLYADQTLDEVRGQPVRRVVRANPLSDDEAFDNHTAITTSSNGNDDEKHVEEDDGGIIDGKKHASPGIFKREIKEECTEEDDDDDCIIVGETHATPDVNVPQRRHIKQEHIEDDDCIWVKECKPTSVRVKREIKREIKEEPQEWLRALITRQESRHKI